MALVLIATLFAGCAGGGAGGIVPLTPGGYGTPAPTPGALAIGTPIFGGSTGGNGTTGGSGSCATGVIFSAVGQSAALPLSQSGYTGSFTVTNTVPSVASAAISGATLVLTALASGTTFVTVKGGDGATAGCNVAVVLPNAAPTGPPAFGTPTFPNGGSGSCATGSMLSFQAAGEYATVPLSEANYTGAFTAISSAPAVASATVSGSTLTVTANAAGTTTVSVADASGNSSTCNVGVTTSAGTVTSHARR